MKFQCVAQIKLFITQYPLVFRVERWRISGTFIFACIGILLDGKYARTFIFQS